MIHESKRVAGYEDRRQRVSAMGAALMLFAWLFAFGTTPRTAIAVGCGDGVVETGEFCDDANSADADGCTSTCEEQSGYSCTGSPSVCTTAGLNVYHIGHSLVNHMMPDMLNDVAVDAGFAHAYNKHRVSSPYSPTLSFKWQNPLIEGDGDSLSFDELPTGTYDILVLTEGLPLDIEADNTSLYAGNFYDLAVDANPTMQVYLYETWYRNQWPDLPTWRAQTAAWRAQWQQVVEDVNAERVGPDMFLVPAGAALIELYDQLESDPSFPELTSFLELFRDAPGGGIDQIHLNELGRYFIALVHYATFYRESPVGLTFETISREGDPFPAPSAALALRMQEIAWQVVSEEPLSGVVVPEPGAPEALVAGVIGLFGLGRRGTSAGNRGGQPKFPDRVQHPESDVRTWQAKVFRDWRLTETL